MENCLAALKNRYPTLPKDVMREIYKGRIERMRGLKTLPVDVRWIIEAKVRLGGEFPDPIARKLPGCGRSSYSKRRRAKRMGVCYKCARWTCNQRCRNIGMASINREDKIKFIKDGLSKESLDNLVETLETHPCGRVQYFILEYWDKFNKEKQRYSLGNLTIKDPVCMTMKRVEHRQKLLYGEQSSK